MVAPTCFGITFPSSGSVPSALWEMFNWGAVDRILWMGVLCLVTLCMAIWDRHALHCHPQGAFLVTSERCSIEERSMLTLTNMSTVNIFNRNMKYLAGHIMSISSTNATVYYGGQFLYYNRVWPRCAVRVTWPVVRRGLTVLCGPPINTTGVVTWVEYSSSST
jgi:hypothetical protein